MHITGGAAIGIILTIIVVVQFLFPAAKESGRIKLPRRKSSTFHQFPTFEDEND